MRNWRYFILILTHFLHSAMAFSAEEKALVKIYALNIPGFHQTDHKGIYDLKIEESLVRSGYAQLIVFPPERAELAFKDCHSCCYSPANNQTEFYDFEDLVVASDPMGSAKAYIFTAEGMPALKSIADLSGKKVGIRQGMHYGKRLTMSAIDFHRVTTIEMNIKKLTAGRIDAFIAYAPDVYQTFKSLELAPFPHNKAAPIAIHQDGIVCRGVRDDFMQMFNLSLKDNP